MALPICALASTLLEMSACRLARAAAAARLFAEILSSFASISRAFALMSLCAAASPVVEWSILLWAAARWWTDANVRESIGPM